MQPSAKTILMADIGIVWVIIVAVVILYRVARWMFRTAPGSVARSSGPVIVTCPKCGRKLRVRPEQHLAALRCAAGKNEFQLPT